MHKKLIRWSFIHALLAVAYIFCVALLMSNGNKIFGSAPNLLGPAMFLLLFVLSAAIMGILIFGNPVLLYLDNQKKDALALLFYTLGWLAVALVLTMLVLIFKFLL